MARPDFEQDLAVPDPIDGEEKAPESGKPPGYSGPEQRCESCQSFDGESQCGKFNSAVDGQGHCSDWSGQAGVDEYNDGGESELTAPEGIEE
jgi:hypothetical protein